MRKEFQDNNQEQIEKAKKNLVYVSIMSIVMLFAGLTSAYIVSMGDAFWVKFPMPIAFWISTGIITASSIAIQFAVYMAKKKNDRGLKAGVVIAFVLGIGFVYFQLQGYKQLSQTGSHFTGSGIMVSEGKYGEYFTLKQDGQFIRVDGNTFYKGSTKMNQADFEALRNFAGEIFEMNYTGPMIIKNNKRYEIYYNDSKVITTDKGLFLNDSVPLENTDRLRLHQLCQHIKDGRGHFYAKGELGKDFKIYYNGPFNGRQYEGEVGYKDGALTIDGRELPAYLDMKSRETADTGSSFLYIITFLHLLHIIVAMLYLLKVVIRSLSGKINSTNSISLRLGAIFWHFLGILWLYLLLFLLFIH